MNIDATFSGESFFIIKFEYSISQLAFCLYYFGGLLISITGKDRPTYLIFHLTTFTPRGRLVNLSRLLCSFIVLELVLIESNFKILIEGTSCACSSDCGDGTPVHTVMKLCAGGLLMLEKGCLRQCFLFFYEILLKDDMGYKNRKHVQGQSEGASCNLCASFTRLVMQEPID